MDRDSIRQNGCMADHFDDAGVPVGEVGALGLPLPAIFIYIYIYIYIYCYLLYIYWEGVWWTNYIYIGRVYGGPF